jgi:hypothetical protein
VVLYLVPLFSSDDRITVRKLLYFQRRLSRAELQRKSIVLVVTSQPVDTDENVRASFFKVKVRLSGVINRFLSFLNTFKEPLIDRCVATEELREVNLLRINLSRFSL